MANGEKINYAALAAARLRGEQTAEDQAALLKEGKLSLPDDKGYDIEEGAPNKTKVQPEEGWGMHAINQEVKNKKFIEKAYQQARGESPGTERLPTAEESRILKEHKHYIWFKEGTKQHFLERTKDSNLSQQERLEIFEQNCEEDLATDIQLIIEDGGLGDWERFVESRSARSETVSNPRTDAATGDVIPEGTFDEPKTQEEIQEEIVVPPGKFDAAETSKPEKANWWEGKVFVQRDTGERFFAYMVQPEKYIVTLKSQKDGHTITKDTSELQQTVAIEGNTWSVIEDASAPKPMELKEHKTEAKDWREVKREVEVDAVGDLHSNYNALVENFKTLGAAKETPDGDLEWTGGNRKVVLIGDVLADRNTSGHEIILAVNKLKKEAAAAGGQLDLLAGNHDDFETSFLMGRETAGGGDPVENAKFGEQGIGLTELYEFGSENLKQSFEQRADEFQGESDPFWRDLAADRPNILENMRKSEKGRQILEGLCDMKIATIHDDNLYVHTDITEPMAKYLLQPGDIHKTVDYINDFYQRNLRKVLLEGNEPEEGFDGLRGLFLNTDNRINFDDLRGRLHEVTSTLVGLSQDEYAQKRQKEEDRLMAQLPKIIETFKKQGINAVFHGHSGIPAGVGISDPDFPVESIDLSAFKYSKDDTKRSVLRVNKDGTLERGTNTQLSTSKGNQLMEIRSL